MAPPSAGEAAIAAAILEALTDRTLAAYAKRPAWAIREEIAADDAIFELEALASPDTLAVAPAAAARPQPRRLISH
jgi:hypothetical protein